MAYLDLRDELLKARDIPAGAAKVERVRELVAHAEESGDISVLIDARLLLLGAHRGLPATRSNHQRYITECSRCVALHAAHADQFTSDQFQLLWDQFFDAARSMIVIDPTLIPAQKLRELLDSMHRHCPPNSLSDLHRLRMTLEGSAGEMETMQEYLTKSYSAMSTDVDRGTIAVNTACLWIEVGRDENAIDTLAPVIQGDIPTPSNAGNKRDYADMLLMCYLRTGRIDEAIAAHKRTAHKKKLEPTSLNSQLFFCATTGNEDRGLPILLRHLHYLGDEIGMLYIMRIGAAATLLARRFVELGRGNEQWKWPDGPNSFQTWTHAKFLNTFYAEVMEYADRLDTAYGTTFQSERIHKIIHTEPFINIPIEQAASTNPSSDHLAEVARLIKAKRAPANAAALLGACERACQESIESKNGNFWTMLLDAIDALITTQSEYVPAKRLHRLFGQLQQHGEEHTVELIMARLKFAAYRGDSNTVADLARRLRELNEPSVIAAVGAAFAELQWDEAVLDLLTPILQRHDKEPLKNLLLLPLLRAGREAEAQEVFASVQGSQNLPPHYLAAQLEYCARTGNEIRGWSILRHHLDFFEEEHRGAHTQQARAAAILLTNRFIAAGQGEQIWHWPASSRESTDESYEWKYDQFAAHLTEEMRTTAKQLALSYRTQHQTSIFRTSSSVLYT